MQMLVLLLCRAGICQGFALLETLHTATGARCQYAAQ